MKTIKKIEAFKFEQMSLINNQLRSINGGSIPTCVNGYYEDNYFSCGWTDFRNGTSSQDSN